MSHVCNKTFESTTGPWDHFERAVFGDPLKPDSTSEGALLAFQDVRRTELTILLRFNDNATDIPLLLGITMHRSHSAISLLHTPSFSPSKTGRSNSHKGPNPFEGLHRSSTIYGDLVDDRKGNLESYRKDLDALANVSRKARHFYETQNEMLDMFAEVDSVLDRTVIEPIGNVETSPLLPKATSSTAQDQLDRKVKLGRLLFFRLLSPILYSTQR